MNSRNRGFGRSLSALLVGATLVTVTAGCSHAMDHAAVTRPAESGFGLGPRESRMHLFTVSLEPAQPLRTRQLQAVTVRLADANGRPVENARITVDGGMPEHGHGLPTQPRVTRALGEGSYQIEGLRFNMGGWWELRLAIEAAAGTDTVTFNLDL